MKYKILLLPLLFLSACAHTELRTAAGQTIFRTEANASYVHYTGNGVELTINNLDHSTTNKIMGDNFKNGAGAVGAGIATSGLLGLVH